MKVRVAGISGSPRKGGNTEELVQEALKGAREIKGVETVFLSLAGKKIQHCTGCLACEKRKGICVLRDEFREFFQTYMEADGIILGSPVYHLSVPSTLKAAIDRLGQSMFATYQGKLPRLSKVGGAIAQGASLYGGQEFTLQFMINSFILENCLVVSGDSPQSKIGVPTSTLGNSFQGKIRENENILSLSRSLGRRVAEMARIVQTGLKQLKNELGSEYFLKSHLDLLAGDQRR